MRTLPAFMLFATLAFAQSGDAPDCSAEGIVIDSITSAPVARVAINGVTSTDATGKWRLEHLPCSRVKFTAIRLGYLQNSIDSRNELNSPDPWHAMTIRLIPQAVMTGAAVDENGDPMQNVSIDLFTSRVIDGSREFVKWKTTVTNDLGEYRLPGLAAGTYKACATPGKSAAMTIQQAYETQCAPPTRVSSGSQGVVDFRFAPVSSHKVGGMVAGVPEGANPQFTLTGSAGAFATAARDDGAFSFENVPAGSYGLTVVAFVDSDRYVASREVEVTAGDVEGLQLHLEKCIDIRATIRIVPSREHSAAAGMPPPQISISLAPLEISLKPGPVWWSEDKSIVTFKSVMPGRYRLQSYNQPPWYMKTATLGATEITGRDFSATPGMPDIEIVLSDDGGTVEGALSGNEKSEAIVLLQDGTLEPWPARTDAHGHFKIEGLPPGSYQATAWDDVSNVEFANSAWMQLNARIVSVTVQPGQTSQIILDRQIAQPE